MNTWEFDSHLEITNQGQSRLVQVWGRNSAQWEDTKEWLFTEDTPGKENPPKPVQGCLSTTPGHWTSTESFKKHFPNFGR